MRPTHDNIKLKLIDYSIPNLQTGCWNWIKSVNRKGYGHLCFGNKLLIAHREAYKAFIGTIPPGILVLHKCDNPSCVNPDHLELGTDVENGAQKAARGRAAPKDGELNGRAKLTLGRVQEIRKWKGKLPASSIAIRFRMSKSAIKHILAERTWTHDPMLGGSKDGG